MIDARFCNATFLLQQCSVYAFTVKATNREGTSPASIAQPICKYIILVILKLCVHVCMCFIFHLSVSISISVSLYLFISLSIFLSLSIASGTLTLSTSVTDTNTDSATISIRVTECIRSAVVNITIYFSQLNANRDTVSLNYPANQEFANFTIDGLDVNAQYNTTVVVFYNDGSGLNTLESEMFRFTTLQDFSGEYIVFVFRGM